eukprot:TRINITY_DN32898_c0_g1_i1.p1 TRINITY_DN32898_c0_g1~~TRINITY_DN32898_c0_g1_i1.p1  ORF type:complete len:228 (-),score=26.69 TRINITY_DN32898_c0_g1_i1:185-868(-)
MEEQYMKCPVAGKEKFPIRKQCYQASVNHNSKRCYHDTAALTCGHDACAIITNKKLPSKAVTCNHNSVTRNCHSINHPSHKTAAGVDIVCNNIKSLHSYGSREAPNRLIAALICIVMLHQLHRAGHHATPTPVTVTLATATRRASTLGPHMRSCAIATAARDPLATGGAVAAGAVAGAGAVGAGAAGATGAVAGAAGAGAVATGAGAVGAIAAGAVATGGGVGGGAA